MKFLMGWLEGMIAKPHGKHHKPGLPRLRSKTGRRRAYALSTMQMADIWHEAVRSVQARYGTA